MGCLRRRGVCKKTVNFTDGPLLHRREEPRKIAEIVKAETWRRVGFLYSLLPLPRSGVSILTRTCRQLPPAKPGRNQGEPPPPIPSGACVWDGVKSRNHPSEFFTQCSTVLRRRALRSKTALWSRSPVCCRSATISNCVCG